MISDKFQSRMKNLLKDDYSEFQNALEKEPVRGLRVNLIKNSVDTFCKISKFEVTPLPYCKNGFILGSNIPVGESAEHHCGMIYMQDPGAMSSLSALDIEKDFWVADLCSAPGGKSSQVAEQLSKDGFILSNEYVPKRAKITVSNFERLGVSNAIVTSLDTKELAKMFRYKFDLVVCDAPCSGEGMFRKSNNAVELWSEENVLNCAKRQSEILENAEKLVKSHGYLLYSTCTYSLEENEMQIDEFLQKHSDFKIVNVKKELEDATADGIQFNGSKCKNLKYTRRFYPHISEGEGQFVALLKRDNDDLIEEILYCDQSKPLSKQEEKIVNEFFDNFLIEKPFGRLAKVGQNIVLISHGCPIPQKSVFMAGVLVGELKGNMLIPSHQFFSVYGKLFKLQENLTRGDTKIEKYLRGEEIPSSNQNGKGWCSILFCGVPLGGGKQSNGVIKNHYPKGIRNK